MTSRINPLYFVAIFLLAALLVALILCPQAEAVIVPKVYYSYLPLVMDGGCRSVCPAGTEACIMVCAR